MRKYLFETILRPIFTLLFSIFYDKQYLRGKYFDYSLIGWKWCFRGILYQKIIGYNKSARWPVSPHISIDDPKSIFFHPDDMNNFMHFGCYYSNANGGRIFIGKGTWIGPNVGIITTNHSKTDLTKHDIPCDVFIGENCWIGMNSIILPGITLPNNTIVGAGSVVTKSIVNEKAIVCGNPAEIKKYFN